MAGIEWDGVRARHSLGSVARRTGLTVPDTGTAMVCCPLPAHDDRHPSMHLDLNRDRYYCFGCGAHGDVVQWVSDIEGVRAAEAVAILDSGRPINGVHTGGPSIRTYPSHPDLYTPDLERTPPERVRTAMQAAWRYYTSPRLHERAIGYLAGERQIDVSALEAEIGQPVAGHTPGGVDGLTRHLHAQGFTDDELVDAGLAARLRGGSFIDFFRDRLILPVTEPGGQVVGLIGRTVIDSRVKYLNQAHTHTYDKHHALYRPTTPALDPDANVIVVEGTLDALAIAAQAASAGLATKYAPVSASGLRLSDEQLDRILAIHDRAPVLAGDGDQPGREANVEWAARAVRKGRETVTVTWPEGQDPASWVATHGEEGLYALTRKGCLDAPPGAVRPRHCGAVLTRAALDRLPAEGHRSIPLRHIADDVAAMSERLGPKAGERYAAAAAEELAQVVVTVGIEAATDGYQLTALLEQVATYGTKLPAAGQMVFAARAAQAVEANGLAAAGWAERKVQAAIRPVNRTNDGVGATAVAGIEVTR